MSNVENKRMNCAIPLSCVAHNMKHTKFGRDARHNNETKKTQNKMKK